MAGRPCLLGLGGMALQARVVAHRSSMPGHLPLQKQALRAATQLAEADSRYHELEQALREERGRSAALEVSAQRAGVYLAAGLGGGKRNGEGSSERSGGAALHNVSPLHITPHLLVTGGGCRRAGAPRRG